MKIIFIDWDCFGRNDVIDAFKHLGHTLITHPADTIVSKIDFDIEYTINLSKIIVKNNVELVFSLNYYPAVSESCHEKGIPYLSLVYDNPFSRIFSINIINNCNYIFTFNRYTYEDLIKKGIQTIYYAPLATNTNRLNKIHLSSSERKLYGSDVSFVGSLYNEKINFYEIVKNSLTERNLQQTLGFIDAMIEAQSKIYGINFLANALSNHILDDLEIAIPYGNSIHHYFTNNSYLQASHCLSMRVTFLERTRLLTALSCLFKTKAFTYDKNANLGNCIIPGTVHHYHDLPKVFKASKINLNITLKSIETGIPLRAIDIMGAGGFLISNYQADFLLHFEPNKDFVFYESEEDLIDKVAYYLRHETERKKIAARGYEKIAKDHTFEKRIAEMLALVKRTDP